MKLIELKDCQSMITVMDRQIILLLEDNKNVSDNQLMTSYYLSYKNYHSQFFLLKEILNRAEDNKSILNILSSRGKNILMTIIRNIANYSQWKNSKTFLSLINISLKIILVMTLEQLNYQFNNYSRVCTYQQDITEAIQQNKPFPNSRFLNIDDNYTQDKIHPGDTSLIYALRLWPATGEIIWSLLQRQINIIPKQYQVWYCEHGNYTQIKSQMVTQIPDEQIPIKIVWKNWKYYSIPQPFELDIYYQLLIYAGKKNIPRGLIRDGKSPHPLTHLGKIYYQCHSRYLIQQTLIRQTIMPTDFINLLFREYLGSYQKN